MTVQKDEDIMSPLLQFLAILGCLATVVSGQQLLMVLGYPFSNVTLLSLDDDTPVPECLQDLNPHPKQLYASCSATLRNSKLPAAFHFF